MERCGLVKGKAETSGLLENSSNLVEMALALKGCGEAQT